jgi:hypothetical protein
MLRYAWVFTSPAVCCCACVDDTDGNTSVVYVWYAILFIISVRRIRNAKNARGNCVYRYGFHISHLAQFWNSLRTIQHTACCRVSDKSLIREIWSALAQITVSRRLLTAEARVCAQVSPCGICGGQQDPVTGSLRVSRFAPINIIPPLLHIYSYIILGTDTERFRGQVPQRHSLTPLQQ